MSSDTNKVVVRRYLEQFVNAGRTELAADLFRADFSNHTAGSDSTSGREGMARRITVLRTAFPDWHVTIESMVAEGEMVVDRIRITATHTGSVNGIPPTGTHIDALGIHMWRLADSKLAEGWSLTEALPAVAAALVPGA